MKKIIITFFAIALTFGAFAQQRDTMFVHKGQTIFHSATAETDSIVFVRTGASVPLGSTVTIRDTVEITVLFEAFSGKTTAVKSRVVPRCKFAVGG